jgi:hypothetical protein
MERALIWLSDSKYGIEVQTPVPNPHQLGRLDGNVMAALELEHGRSASTTHILEKKLVLRKPGIVEAEDVECGNGDYGWCGLVTVIWLETRWTTP